MAASNMPEMPCTPILELHGQRKRMGVPFGLKPLLEKLAREVIRNQPENIHVYLASFMEDRVRQKSQRTSMNAKRKSWQVHHWSFEASSALPPDELQEFLGTLKANEEVATKSAIVIQSRFRGYKARVAVKEIRRSRQQPSIGVTQPKGDSGEGEEETAVIAEMPVGGQANYDMNEEHEESDFDSRNYEMEEEEEMPRYETTEEEEEESTNDSIPPPLHEEPEQTPELQMEKPVPQVESVVDAASVPEPPSQEPPPPSGEGQEESSEAEPED